jgi:hypothetical protein
MTTNIVADGQVLKLEIWLRGQVEVVTLAECTLACLLQAVEGLFADFRGVDMMYYLTSEGDKLSVDTDEHVQGLFHFFFVNCRPPWAEIFVQEVR